MFGLLMGYIVLWPMNWLMVKLGWKHGVGDTQSRKKHQIKFSGARYGLLATMSVLGVAALMVSAWFVAVRYDIPAQSANRESGLVADFVNFPGGSNDGLRAGVDHLNRDQENALDIAFGGAWDVWGGLDLGAGERSMRLSAESLAGGESQMIGESRVSAAPVELDEMASAHSR